MVSFESLLAEEQENSKWLKELQPVLLSHIPTKTQILLFINKKYTTNKKITKTQHSSIKHVSYV